MTYAADRVLAYMQTIGELCLILHSHNHPYKPIYISFDPGWVVIFKLSDTGWVGLHTHMQARPVAPWTFDPTVPTVEICTHTHTEMWL